MDRNFEINASRFYMEAIYLYDLGYGPQGSGPVIKPFSADIHKL